MTYDSNSNNRYNMCCMLYYWLLSTIFNSDKWYMLLNISSKLFVNNCANTQLG